MKLFVKCKRDGGDCFLSFEGQDMETVENSLSSLGATNVEFMEETDWEAARPKSKGI